MAAFDFNIIDWRKLDTYNNPWAGLWFTICHPILAWKYDRNTYKSFLWRVINFFTTTLPSYTPFSKACRWLAYNLIHNIDNTKYLDDFLARKHGGYTTYYSGKAAFGYYVVYELYYKRNCDTDSQKPRKKKLFSGWVFTKKKAISLYKSIVLSHKKLYNPDGVKHPEIAQPWVMHIVDDMGLILMEGHPNQDERYLIDSHIYSERYFSTKDNIEKLWAYSAYLLSCPNDFHAHEKLAWIFRTCDNYLYYKAMKTDPTIDESYNTTLKNCGEKEAKKWLNQCIKDHTPMKIRMELIKKLAELRKFYEDEPFDYYRV